MAHFRCIRCGVVNPPAPDTPPGLPTVHVCSYCLLLHVVRDMGEMDKPDDRADPDEWGGVGWT